MKKEREIIAKNNNKKFFVFVLIGFLVSFPIGFNFLDNADWRWFGIFFMSVIIFTIIFSLLMLIILPNYTIVKESDKFIISFGIFKETILMQTIIGVEIAPLKNGEIVSKNGNILIKVKNENNEEKVFTINVTNKEEVVERMNALINQ